MRVERLFIPGPAGVLEALLEWDPQVAVNLGAIVCHPHPLYGGTMHSKVVKPKLIMQGTEDAYGPRSKVQVLFDRLDEPKRLHWVEGADHFVTKRLEEVQAAIRGWLKEVLDV